MSAGGIEEKNPAGGEGRRLLKLKNPATFLKDLCQRNHSHTDEDRCSHPDQNQNPQQRQEYNQNLQEISRRLIVREEQLFSQDPPPGDEDELQRDLEVLKVKIWMLVHSLFTLSLGHIDALRSAAAAIQQQEEQDQRWMRRPDHRVPVWRPMKCLSTFSVLLQNMVTSRMTEAAEDETSGPDELSSPMKREVCRLGKRVKDDLLWLVRTVIDCFPPQMDVLNVFARLYNQSFSAKLSQFAASALGPDDCSYLLFWVNKCYAQTILNHEELQGHIKTACLGSLLQRHHLEYLEDQYLNHKEVKVKQWLKALLDREEQCWVGGVTPELLHTWFFSPLAADVIQVVSSSVTEFDHVISEHSKIQRITIHLETFIHRYQRSMEWFVSGNYGNKGPVIKAQLFCELQLRDYITGLTGGLTLEQQRRCMDMLSSLRDSGHRFFTCPIHVQLKVWYHHLWTPMWLDGSLPVMESLLDCLSQHLADLTDLNPLCRESLMGVVHQQVILQYAKRLMKTMMRSRKEQVGGANRTKEDAQKITVFFRERGCSASLWLQEVLCSLAEVVSLQDPESLELELLSLLRTCPDLRDVHVGALLSLRSDLSAADVVSIRRRLEDHRLQDVSTHHSHAFFSKVKIKWIHTKMAQMGLRR